MKKFLILIVILIGLAAALYFYLRDRKLDDFEPQLIGKIADLVKEGTDGLYKLDIGDLEVDVVNSRITLLNARLSPDSAVLNEMDARQKAPNEIIFLEVDRLNIEGIGPDALIETRNIDLDTLLISNPKIRIYYTDRKYNDTVSIDTTSINRKILEGIDRFKLNRLLIQDADITHYNVSKENKVTAIEKVTIDIQDILIDSTSVLDTTRILYAKDAQIRFEDYAFRTADSVYTINVGAVFISAAKKDVELLDVALKPRISKQQFVKQQKEVKELYTLYFSEISLNSIKWWELLNDEKLIAESVELKNGDLQVYCNRTLPAFSGSKVGNYPHQVLMKVPLDIYIKKLSISDFDIQYEEYNPKSEKAGILKFLNASGTVNNVTNSERFIKENPNMIANAHAQLMGYASINATFNFNLARHKEGIFSVNIKMGKMDGTLLNPVTEPLGMFTIKSLNINSIEARINGSDHRGNGNVKIFYDDLKIIPLKQSDDEAGGLKQRGFLGFLANTFIVKSENKPGKNARLPNSTFTRETNKSFFALIWKTMLSGLLEAVGAPAEMAKGSDSKD